MSLETAIRRLAIRTTDRRGHTGAGCRECGVSFQMCTEGIFSGPEGRACCGACRVTDTHEARPPAPNPEPVAAELARVLAGLPTGAEVPAADLAAAESLQRELAGRGIWLARVPR